MILDTNALSAWAEGQPEIRPKLTAATRLVLPAVALGEYLFGISQSRYRERYEQWLAQNLPTVEVAVVTVETARAYAAIRLGLRQRAPPIPANDTWIAATAMQYALPILTNDAHFDAVPEVQRIAY